MDRALVMILEDLGVHSRVFLELQEDAIADAFCVDNSIAEFRRVLGGNGLGKEFRLSFILKRLENISNEMNLSMFNQNRLVSSAFWSRLRSVAKNSVLRDIKHGARIRIPGSWKLVGVADEGPAYVQDGKPNVYLLPAGKIFGERSPSRNVAVIDKKPYFSLCSTT
jgi:RNA-dependent RNA polymerase